MSKGASIKSLVEQAKKTATGRVEPQDSIIRELVAHIERLEREKEEAIEWNKQMVAKAAEEHDLDGYRELGAKLAAAETRAEAAESELTRLKSPMEGAKVSAEELVEWREAANSGFHFMRMETADMGRLLADLDHATAQARGLEDEVNRLLAIYTPNGWTSPPDDVSKGIHNILTHLADFIRARRKGETG